VGPVIDVVGHFGTTFSYATVASNVAAALLERGLLGSVVNMDPEWHDAHAGLRRDGSGQGSHVAVFTAPFHYIDAYPQMYGDRSAIFMSPNTDQLSEEHAKTCAAFGLALAPSAWCEATVHRALPDMPVAVLPLGVEPGYAAERPERVARLLSRVWNPPHVLHFSTDQFWPGRKGTWELLWAWRLLERDGLLLGARLTLHVPPALQADAMYRVRDLHLEASVSVVTGATRGSPHAPLLALLEEADLVLAPSRCEGFGMMLLASLVAGVPLVCTYVTGHADFLAEARGWLGIPTAHTAPLAGEEGAAPRVDGGAVAQALSVALRAEARQALLSPLLRDDIARDWGTWNEAAPLWAERLEEWTKETA